LQYWNYYEWIVVALTLSILVFRCMVIHGLDGIDFELSGPFINMQRLTDLKHTEEGLLAILILMCWLRALKLLRIPPFTGPVTQSIMEVITSIYAVID
jgi:hypothetical protein